MNFDVQNRGKVSKPLLSVVLCTYNNAESLSVTLSQLARQTSQASRYTEIIVVDNNSSDNTKSVVTEAVATSNIQMRYIFEPNQGLSNARNTGMSHASGEYILFTDDDADIPSTWIDSYISEIDKLQPDCLYSKIYVIWDQDRPWWYTDKYRPLFVELDYGNHVLSITNINKEFFGKNFCIRKSKLLELGGFNPQLGRSGSKLLAGEETLIYRQLIKSRASVIYFPDAPVGHRLKPREYAEDDIKRQILDSAQSSFYLAKQFSSKRIFKRPTGYIIEAIRAWPKKAALSIYYALRGNKVESFYYSLQRQRLTRNIRLWLKNP